MQLAKHGGGDLSCESTDPGAPTSATLEGTIHEKTPGELVLDSCHPTADCEPMVSILLVAMPGMVPSIPDGTFVRISAQTSVNEGHWVGCSRQLVVHNLPLWGELPNPTSEGSFVWFAGSDSYNTGDYAPPDAPFVIGHDIACSSKFGDSYAWRVSAPDAPGAEATAKMGETVPWSVPSGMLAGEYLLRNLRSTAFGHPDYAWCLTRQ